MQNTTCIESWMKLAVPQLLSMIVIHKGSTGSSEEGSASGSGTSTDEDSSTKDSIVESARQRRRRKAAAGQQQTYMQGKEMVLFYQYLTVLKTLLENSSAAKTFCVKSYNEELRYFNFYAKTFFVHL